MRLFGKSKSAKKAESPQDSIMQMKSTAEMLEKKENHLLSKIASEEVSARSLASTNRSQALMCLKRRKMYEQQLEHTRGARFNLETQIIAIESANMNLETLGAMRTGSAAMKAIHGALDVERVDEAVDDIREQMELAQEVSQAISMPLGMGEVDEDELWGELERMEQEELDKSLLGMPANTSPLVKSASSPGLVQPLIKSPSYANVIPNHASNTNSNKSIKEDEEEELRKLQESMLS